MKKVLSFCILFTLSLGNYAQDNDSYNKWSIGVNFGGHDALVPVTNATKFFTYAGLNGRYMINNRFGFMADLGYDSFSWKTDSLTNNTNLMRFSLEGVMNLGDILRFNTWTSHIGLLMHGGGGYSQMWQKDAYSFGAGDKIMNFTVGMTPQFKLSDKFVVNLDWSAIYNARQDQNFDFLTKNERSIENAYYTTLSLGVSYYFGKNSKHADWVVTEFGDSNEALEARFSLMEAQLKDDDGDGVVNGNDLEPNTPSGVLVNSNGEAIVVAVDTDGDGITDEFDQCPTEKGSFSTNGCPDADGDGVIDNKDKCPNEFGSAANNGCIVDNQTQRVFDEALHGILFETGKDVIKKSSYAILTQVVDVLYAYPQYTLEIHGHTDNSGDAAKNLALSEARAIAVKNFLIKKGIKADRIKTFGHGDTLPMATNDTDAGRADNRRVEFKLAN